jgi:hypothetical protein
MTVYVDDAGIPASVRNGSRTHTSTWCHLTADTQEELHAFAAHLGLKRSYFQSGKPIGGKPSPFWHYDVTAGKRAQAVRFGAVEVTYRDMPALMRDREARGGAAAAPVPLQPTKSAGCNVPECGQPGHPYAAGIRCDAHKPASTFRPSREVPADNGGICPCCSKSQLAAGREICQGCGAAAAVQPPPGRGFADLSHGQPGHMCVLPDRTGREAEAGS